ncbi:isocitrate lyase/PEP mutase family protein [Rhodobacteraceae bacterium RKSG542]|uniref:isocitrate lyase/PEP mutase family protein n=1 Tax=Pseudovibrio flavus TaxID=2529854 RepID=UPI0012BC4A7E|nr:isocitrate lyase/PEP mutase family protein [Pseudovibrio flavus]MTI15815.1 isocitrate lyase/PEP mutase family protein [Pseudovibrio flavus]
MTTNIENLRALYNNADLTITPCCWDALSAQLIEQAGFALAFMSGFGVSASRIGMPDAGLLSFGEIVDQARNIAGATNIPVIGDGDTGYGNALNVKRTVKAYANAGVACIMIEDQVAPKRCGHTKGKAVVDRAEAFMRIKAAVDARSEGQDILILARTDAAAGEGLDEAIARAQEFRKLGADITFVEAPRSVEEMQRICNEVEGPKMANMLEGGLTPFLPPAQLQALGYSIATYPFTGLMASIKAQQDALEQMKKGLFPEPPMSFADLRKVVGFEDYYEAEEHYKH